MLSYSSQESFRPQHCPQPNSGLLKGLWPNHPPLQCHTPRGASSQYNMLRATPSSLDCFFPTSELPSRSISLHFIYKFFQYTSVLVGLLKICQRNAGNGKNISLEPSVPPPIHQSCLAHQGGPHLELVNSDY